MQYIVSTIVPISLKLPWDIAVNRAVSNQKQKAQRTCRVYMMTSSNGNIFRVTGPLCAGNSPVTGEFPAQSPVTRSFDVFFICAWINGWVNNREAGDLRCHRAHYDVIVMISLRTVVTECMFMLTLLLHGFNRELFILSLQGLWSIAISVPYAL